MTAPSQDPGVLMFDVQCREGGGVPGLARPNPHSLHRATVPYGKVDQGPDPPSQDPSAFTRLRPPREASPLQTWTL
jgi:hypothetical protein